MSIKKIFKSRIPSQSYIFRSGAAAYFIGGKFTTDLQSEIDELTEVCKSGNPYFFIDSTESEVDSEALSPIEIIKKRAIEEYKESLRIASDKNNNMGTSDSGKFSASIGNSSSNSETSAESTSSADLASSLKAAIAAKTK